MRWDWRAERYWKRASQWVTDLPPRLIRGKMLCLCCGLLPAAGQFLTRYSVRLVPLCVQCAKELASGRRYEE